MILLISLLIICVVSVIVYRSTYESGVELTCFLTGIFSGLFFLLGVIMIPVCHYDFHRNTARLEAFKQTLETSRKENPTDLERVAIMQQISKWNQWIASEKFTNKGMWDLWVPDEVEQIEFVK